MLGLQYYTKLSSTVTIRKLKPDNGFFRQTSRRKLFILKTKKKAIKDTAINSTILRTK